MKDMYGAGKLGERLYNNFELDFKNLEYQDVLNLQKITNENVSFENEDIKSNQTIKEEIVEQNTNEFSSLDTLDEISRTVAAAVVMCEDEKNLNTIDSLLDLLYESKEKANIMYLKNKSDEAKEYCDLLDGLIKNYEEEKLILNNIVTK